MWSERKPSTCTRQAIVRVARSSAITSRRLGRETNSRRPSRRRERVVDVLVVALADQQSDPEEEAGRERVGEERRPPLREVGHDVQPRQPLERARVDDVRRPVPVVADDEHVTRARRRRARSSPPRRTAAPACRAASMSLGRGSRDRTPRRQPRPRPRARRRRRSSDVLALVLGLARALLVELRVAALALDALLELVRAARVLDRRLAVRSACGAAPAPRTRATRPSRDGPRPSSRACRAGFAGVAAGAQAGDQQPREHRRATGRRRRRGDDGELHAVQVPVRPVRVRRARGVYSRA